MSCVLRTRINSSLRDFGSFVHSPMGGACKSSPPMTTFLEQCRILDCNCFRCRCGSCRNFKRRAMLCPQTWMWIFSTTCSRMNATRLLHRQARRDTDRCRIPCQRESPKGGSPRVREDPLGTPPLSLSAKKVLREPRGGPENLGRRRVLEVRDTEPN